MSRISSVIDDARYALSDLTGSRYSDDRLISLYNKCILDIALQSSLLKGKALVSLEANKSTYVLDDDILSIDRVQYLTTNINIVSHSELDSVLEDWETATGSEVTNCVTNLLNPQVIKIYPLLTDVTIDSMSVEKATFTNSDDIPDEITTKYLVIYYTKIPKVININTPDSELEFSKTWDNAIQTYITGMALQDDADQQNRSAGADKLTLYNRELNSAISKAVSSSVQTTYTTKYNTVFNN